MFVQNYSTEGNSLSVSSGQAYLCKGMRKGGPMLMVGN